MNKQRKNKNNGRQLGTLETENTQDLGLRTEKASGHTEKRLKNTNKRKRSERKQLVFIDSLCIFSSPLRVWHV
jgi:hypothetical protein